MCGYTMGSTKNEHQHKLQRVMTILGTSRSRTNLVRLLSQRVRIATAVFLVHASTINTIAVIVNLQITFAILRIVTGETILYVVGACSHLLPFPL